MHICNENGLEWNTSDCAQHKHLQTQKSCCDSHTEEDNSCCKNVFLYSISASFSNYQKIHADEFIPNTVFSSIITIVQAHIEIPMDTHTTVAAHSPPEPSRLCVFQI